jgi:endonuclease/exonuclease/phosphatase (EEP) superfamily protein YafD
MANPSPARASARARPQRSAAATALAVALIAAPWLWFPLRDQDGGLADTLAVGLPLVGAGAFLILGLVAILRRRWLPLLVGISIFLACLSAIVEPRVPRSGPAPERPVRIAMANVYDRNTEPDAAIAALDARSVDVLATVEMGPTFWERLDGIPSLPFNVVYGEMGVHSRWPMTLLRPAGLPRSRVLRIRVDAPGRPFVLYVAHALNPMHDISTFAAQQAFARSIVAAAAQERHPVVMIGDFNTSDRALAYRIFDRSLRDAMRVGTVAASTYFGGWWPALLLRIDHAFVSTDWCAADGSTFTVPGSDHHGIQVTVGPCP